MKSKVAFLIASAALFLALVVCLAVGLPILVAQENDLARDSVVVSSQRRAASSDQALRLTQPEMEVLLFYRVFFFFFVWLFF